MSESLTPSNPEPREAHTALRVEMDDYRNLLVNGRRLEPSAGSELLQTVLTENRTTIREGLERYRRHWQLNHPSDQVSLAPFSVMYFGMGPARTQVLTDAAVIENTKKFQIYKEIELVNDEFKPFWQAVEAANLTPDIRVFYRGPDYDVSLWAQLPEEERH